MSSLIGYVFALGCAMIVILGDVAMKLAADRGHDLWSPLIAAGTVLYVMSGIAWFMAMRQISLAQAGVAYAMFSLLALCALDVLAFGQTLSSREYAGIACAVLAIILMVRIV